MEQPWYIFPDLPAWPNCICLFMQHKKLLKSVEESGKDGSIGFWLKLQAHLPHTIHEASLRGYSQMAHHCRQIIVKIRLIFYAKSCKYRLIRQIMPFTKFNPYAKLNKYHFLNKTFSFSNYWSIHLDGSIDKTSVYNNTVTVFNSIHSIDRVHQPGNAPLLLRIESNAYAFAFASSSYQSRN